MDTDKNPYLHEVVVTGMIRRPEDGRYLIVRRPASKKRYPNRWTIPGGRLERGDYEDLPLDTPHGVSNVLPRVLEREARQEAGVEIKNLVYLGELVIVHKVDDVASVVHRYLAEWVSGDFVPQPGETVDHAWILPHEREPYDLLGNIGEDMDLADLLFRKMNAT